MQGLCPLTNNRRQKAGGLCYSGSGSRRVQRAFSLIELMVVMAVVAILAGITLAAMGSVNQKAARERTKAEIAAMATALEAYKSQHGEYPSPPGGGGEGVPFALIRGYLADNRIEVVNNVPQDPFGAAYRYRPAGTGTRNRLTFDLWSTAGAGANDREKHIGNW
jgi:type II secretion system protein G